MIIILMPIVLMILLNSPHSLPPVLPLFPHTTETPLINTPLHGLGDTHGGLGDKHCLGV